MIAQILVSMMTSCLLLSVSHDAQDPGDLPPIVVIDDVTAQDSVKFAATAGEPIVIRSVDEAKNHFSDDELAKLTDRIDFEQQVVLVFAWIGSSRDEMEIQVLESYPEQILFTHRPGLPRDVHEHVVVYALRANVRWSVAD